MGDRRLAALKPAAPDPAALFAQVVSAPRLEAAWAKVRANDGAAGGDGVSVRAFEGDSARRLGRLAEALATGEYRPGPIRHVEIPKPQGGMRGLSIPCVVDRVAQTSAHEVLGPILDAEFEDTSFAYRPGRGVADAVRRVAALREEGYAWLLDADIEAFFDNVPHERLIDRLGESLPDGPLTNLISLWITHAAPSGRGLPQGSPISPLLANLYLDRADEALQGKGHRLVRFADDFVILAKDQGGAEAALALAGRVLGDLGLRLNAEKTKVTSFDQGFRFLGHLFVRSLVMKTGPVESDMARVEADLAAIARSDQTRAAKARKAEAEEETRSAAGLAAAFRVLYLRSPDRRLGLRNTAFSVQEGAGVGGAVEWREILAIPHQDVDRIEIYPDAQILPEALRHALARDTQVAFVSGRGETLGVASSDVTGHGARHLAQAAVVLDAARRLDLAARIVDGRLRNQRALLRRLGRNKTDDTKTGGGDVAALEGLNALIRKAPRAASLTELMGYEGHGAALFWPALSGRLNHGFTMAGRDRRPPPDPPNLALNFLCALLARDIAVVLARAGLHAGFGVLHATGDRREAAVYDLMEEFRAPLTESVMVYLFNNRILGRTHFTDAPGGGVAIDREGGDRLIRAYEAAAERVLRHPRTGRRGSWRTMMLEQAFALVAHVEGRTPYQAMTLDY